MSGVEHVANGRFAITVDVSNGAKITSLVDQRSGRDWMYPATLVSENKLHSPSVFGPQESFGWDELFPTVLSGAEAPAPWSTPLRDHGELWGRPWDLTERTERSLTCAYRACNFCFTRRLELINERAMLSYIVENTGDAIFPFFWSMHPILAVRPGDRIVLPSTVRSVTATYWCHNRLPWSNDLSWPVASSESESVDLSLIRPPDGVSAAKLYAGPLSRPHYGVVAVDGALWFEADPRSVPFVGLYLNLGGWPAAGSPLYQIGIEPTMAPVDDLAAAVTNRFAVPLNPGDAATWTVSVSVDNHLPGYYDRFQSSE